MPHMRRYTLTLLGLIAVALIAATGVSWFGLDQCPLVDRNLCGVYHFQRAKLAAAPETVDLVMLGDSSLGNGVDGKVMAELTGRTTLNLATSGGSLGLGSNYIQLQDALVSHRIRNVVIMFSPAGFRHRFKRAAEGYVFATGGDLRRAAVSPRVFFHSLLAMSRMLFDIRSLSAGARRLALGIETDGDCIGCDERDYPKQTRTTFRDNGDLKRWRGPVADFDPFLIRIAALCRSAEINCLYMHGPIIQSVLDNNPGYIAKVNAKVTAAGLKLVDPQPIIIADGESGDAINHVRPDLRTTYTERIYRQIAPLLK
jgi:hypothetical protein